MRSALQENAAAFKLLLIFLHTQNADYRDMHASLLQKSIG